jgi:tetratricopeptide (TPR) repeat protein
VLKQGRSLDQIKNQIPYEHVKLKENLALIYYQNNHYKEALEILKDLKQTDFSEDLSQKINDSLKKVAASKKLKELPKKGNDKEISLFDTYKNQITEAQKNVDYVQVLKVATEALESFPVQPYFFYASGLAHNELNNPNEAIKVLEESLDLLLDDSNLNDNIYRELAKAHTAQGNTSKANMYLSKIKSGS